MPPPNGPRAVQQGTLVARIDDLLIAAIKAAGPKPADDAPQGIKNPWVGKLSNTLAMAIAQELRHRGMKEARPATPGELGLSGAERRLAGGIGAKKVDVTWATEESGLILACSVKTIMFRDGKTGQYQKNLTNRRGDLLVEAVTLHRRFPYAVIAGFLFLDHLAAEDGTARRNSTFANAFPRLRLFTRRPPPPPPPPPGRPGRTVPPPLSPPGRPQRFPAPSHLLRGARPRYTGRPAQDPRRHRGTSRRTELRSVRSYWRRQCSATLGTRPTASTSDVKWGHAWGLAMAGGGGDTVFDAQRESQGLFSACRFA